MHDADIGDVLVTDGGSFVGIVTGRDLAAQRNATRFWTRSAPPRRTPDDMRGACSARGMRAAATLAVLLAAPALPAGCGDEASLPDDSDQARTVTVDIGDGQARPQPDDGSSDDVPGADSCDGANAATTEENLRQAEIAVRCLTNAARRENGLPELAFDERLARAAANRSQAMADADFFGHDGPGDSNVRSATRATGWVPDDRSWVVGENIGWAEAEATPALIVRSWLGSQRHRANILGQHFRQIGVGAVAAVPRQDAQAGATFTQIFGATGEAARAAQTGG